MKKIFLSSLEANEGDADTAERDLQFSQTNWLEDVTRPSVKREGKKFLRAPVALAEQNQQSRGSEKTELTDVEG